MSEAKPPTLVIELCRTLVEATARGGVYSLISVITLRKSLGVPRKELDRAIAYAIDAELVSTDEVLAGSLTVTYEGIELASTSRP